MGCQPSTRAVWSLESSSPPGRQTPTLCVQLSRASSARCLQQHPRRGPQCACRSPLHRGIAGERLRVLLRRPLPLSTPALDALDARGSSRSRSRRRGYQQAAAAVGWPIHSHGVPEPQGLHARAPRGADAVQPIDQLERRPAQALPRAGRCPPAPGPVSDPGQEGKHEAELLLNRRLVRGIMHYLVRWRGRINF